MKPKNLMVRHKRSSSQKIKIEIIETALIVIGIMIIVVSLITWIPKEESELMFKINLLSFSIGTLYILFALILKKFKI